MEELEGSARGVSLRAAASMVAGDTHDPIAGQRVRRAVDLQLRRAGIEPQDAADVRTEVVLALLSAPAPGLPLPLDLVCARASAIARNKAIDHGRRRARAPIALGDALPEPPQPARSPGSLADGLDDVAAAAHTRQVQADLAAALARLDAPQRAAISAHAQGGAARAAGLPRSTYYRALGHAQSLLQSDLRGRLAGIGALGGITQRAREIFAHAEALHAATVAVAATVAISAAVVLAVHDETAHRFETPAPAVRIHGGRVQATPVAAVPPRARHRRAAASASVRSAPPSTPAPAVKVTHPASCRYDPSSYDPC
jgi:DNA-directed RNA polymerase specialized sigma24 family protein